MKAVKTMLTIRKEQVEALSAAGVENFIDRAAEHVGKFFPEHVKALSGERLREDIRYGITRAASHGIVAERDVCKYIDLLFAFGRDFDTDMGLDWAQAILGGSEMDDPTEKADMLYNQGMASFI
jgi:hypothetical protein